MLSTSMVTLSHRDKLFVEWVDVRLHAKIIGPDDHSNKNADIRRPLKKLVNNGFHHAIGLS